ncbi:MAG TPA: alcohol dehydrogenase catalytic domain-containing protein, partial [Verrucomicrobiae bacterium]|nr:alcohol dehydrogenase catalytic domain-containing protein [Verrucomicrobiae bacterium]
MKAMVLNKKAGAEALVPAEIPQPQPQAGELLVQVHATAVMPTETEWDPTFNQKSGEPRPFPIVLSHEFSGTIAALGPDVKNLKVG